jgi:enamine deaminase RidA (YjgF/YER057c/UK114 family)
MPNVEKLSVSLPPHRAEYLRKKSAETGIPVSHLIEGALAELERLEILDELLADLTDVVHDEVFAARLRKSVGR